MSEDIPLEQQPSDEDRFMKFQLEMMEASKACIEKHAPGLPVEVLKEYMQQIGGDVFALTRESVGTSNKNPFRIRVTTEEVMATSPDGVLFPVYFIKDVKGWG